MVLGLVAHSARQRLSSLGILCLLGNSDGEDFTEDAFDEIYSTVNTTFKDIRRPSQPSWKGSRASYRTDFKTTSVELFKTLRRLDL